MADNNEIVSEQCTSDSSIPGSNSSDSGVSSDQQLSPMLPDVEDDYHEEVVSSVDTQEFGHEMYTEEVFCDEHTGMPVAEEIELHSSVQYDFDSVMDDAILENTQNIVGISKYCLLFIVPKFHSRFSCLVSFE